MAQRKISRGQLERDLRIAQSDIRYLTMLVLSHHRLISKLKYDVNGSSGFDYTPDGNATLKAGITTGSQSGSVSGRGADSFPWYPPKVIANIRITSDRMTSEIP